MTTKPVVFFFNYNPDNYTTFRAITTKYKARGVTTVADNFNFPYFSFEAAGGSVAGGDRGTFNTGTLINVLDNYYGVGSVQLYHFLRIASFVGEISNIGSVSDESSIRRNLGTWHRQRAGYVTSSSEILYEAQEFQWTGRTYPFERSRASDPGRIVPSKEIQLDFVNRGRVQIGVDPVTMVPRDRDTVDPNNPTPVTREFPVAQYEIRDGCLTMRPSGADIELNFFEPDNYRKLGQLSLAFDDDTIVIRPFAGVGMAYEYRSYIIVASETSSSSRVVGASVVADCPQNVPFYPDLGPNMVFP